MHIESPWSRGQGERDDTRWNIESSDLRLRAGSVNTMSRVSIIIINSLWNPRDVTKTCFAYLHTEARVLAYKYRHQCEKLIGVSTFANEIKRRQAAVCTQRLRCP